MQKREILQQPLQMVLRRILLQNAAFASGNGGIQGGCAQSSADQVKCAVIIASTVPIPCVSLFRRISRRAS